MGTIDEIAPLLGTDAKRKDFDAQRTASAATIDACREPRARDWLPGSLGYGLACGLILGLILEMVLNTVWASVACGLGLPLLLASASRSFARHDRAQAVEKLAPGELEWHRRFVEFHPAVLDFDERLSALKAFAAHAEPDQEVDPAVVEKYRAEGAEHGRKLRALMREHALHRFGKAISRSEDGRYRDTRDVSDAVFLNRALQEDAERDLSETTMPAEDSRFRIEDDDACEEPPETAARASS